MLAKLPKTCFESDWQFLNGFGVVWTLKIQEKEPLNSFLSFFNYSKITKSRFFNKKKRFANSNKKWQTFIFQNFANTKQVITRALELHWREKVVRWIGFFKTRSPVNVLSLEAFKTSLKNGPDKKNRTRQKVETEKKSGPKKWKS